MTKAQVIALIDQYITTNGNEEITGAQTNSVMKALANQDIPFSEIVSKPTTLSGYGITDGALKAITINAGTGLTGGGNLSANRTINFDTSWGDNRYVNVTGDTMTGNLTGTGANPFIINGSGIGDSNIAYIPFYESNGTTRQGYVGFPSSSSSDLTVRNGVSSKSLTLETGGQLSYNGPATFTGTITGNGTQAFNAVGIASGASNSVIIGFYESNGTTRQGYVGFPSTSNTDLYLANNVIGNNLRLDNAGVNGLKYYDGTSTLTVYHSGNLRSDAQNDSRYVQQTRTITAGDGLTGGGNLSSNRTLSVDSTVARTNVAETFSSTVTATGFYESSDIRLKDNISPLKYGLKEIEKIDTHTWNWKNNNESDIGVIAQELEEIIPQLVKTNEEGYKSVNYPKLIPILINSIKDLSNQVKALKNG